jgi:hypothetical protein
MKLFDNYIEDTIHISNILTMEYLPLATIDLTYRFAYKYKFPYETDWNIGRIEYASFEVGYDMLAFACNHIPVKMEANDLMKEICEREM